MADLLRSAELIVSSLAIVHFVGGFAGASLATLSWQRSNFSFPLVAGVVIFLGWQAMGVFAGVHDARIALDAADQAEIGLAIVTSSIAGVLFAWMVGATSDV